MLLKLAEWTFLPTGQSQQNNIWPIPESWYTELADIRVIVFFQNENQLKLWEKYYKCIYGTKLSQYASMYFSREIWPKEIVMYFYGFPKHFKGITEIIAVSGHNKSYAYKKD